MLKACVHAVDKLGISSGQVAYLSAPSTARFEYLTNQVLFGHSLHTAYGQASGTYRQLVLDFSKLLVSFLYPLSTLPMTNTKLIKD